MKKTKYRQVQNNVKTITWMILGSRPGEIVNSLGIFLAIGLPEEDIVKIGEETSW